MSEDKIRYDVLASEALRGIIRTVLTRVQKRGLPGDHHFYLTFDTGAAGTILSKRLKAQYPDEMMIVLQHKFWDLLVYDDRFEVKLSFSGIPERLVIPFAAIKTFYDPSVRFGFNPTMMPPVPSVDDQLDVDTGEPQEERLALPRATLKIQPDAETGGPETEPPIRQEEQPKQDSAKIVELDMFRKR